MLKLDRMHGSLLGLAIGDALGAPIEFSKPGSFKPINDFHSGGMFKLNAGEFTDDTSMALCLAESLTRCNGFDAKDQMETYWKWLAEGHLSVRDKAIDACKYFGGLIWGALNEVSKEELLSANYSPIDGYWDEHEMELDLSLVSLGSFKEKNPPEIIGSGYVVESLEAALWAFYNSDNFEEGVLKAVNLGNDADTTGAIYGQLAGGYYGLEAIPDRFKNNIAMKDLILSYSQNLIFKKAI